MNPAEELRKIADVLDKRADCGHCEPKNAARDLAQQREVLQQAPKENLINLLTQEGLSLEAAEQFGYTGEREPAADWMRENVDEAKIQGLFYNWSPGTPEEGEVMLQAVGI
jgi:hypothetical protein